MEGIWKIDGANAVWMDPVAVLSCNYTEFELSRDRYYSRSTSDIQHFTRGDVASDGTEMASRKRKRKRKKKEYVPNEMEQLAELRHQDARLAILNAHSSFLKSSIDAFSSGATMGCSGDGNEQMSASGKSEGQDVNFRQMAEVWQAPFYEISILKSGSGAGAEDATEEEVPRTFQLFNTMIENRGYESLAKCAETMFLLPKGSRFVLKYVNSYRPKAMVRYPLMPNKQLFSLPVKQLAHREGCLVALWLTNREKLHRFVENELFPAWGVELAASWYWLKLNANGEMISPLDLQHHKPYECLLLGYLYPKQQEKALRDKIDGVSTSEETSRSGPVRPPENFIVMSVPGDHSRKPPISSLLALHAPGPRPINGLELFARELNPGWTSWGNEPLHFQRMKYFVKKS